MSNKIAQVILGFIWIIASLALVNYAYPIISDLGGFIDDPFYNVLYWLGIVSLAIACGILPSYHLVVSAFKEES